MVKQLGVHRMEFSDGNVLADELRPSTQMGILLSGNLHVYDSAFKGKRHLVRIVHPGGVIGASLVGASQPISAYPALVAAHGDCVLASLPLSALYKCVKNGGGRLYDNLSCAVREELQAAWRKIAILSCPKIEDRVLLYLQNRCRQEGTKTFAIGSTESEFADYLGVSRSALARCLRQLAKSGHFSYDRDVFTILR